MFDFLFSKYKAFGLKNTVKLFILPMLKSIFTKKESHILSRPAIREYILDVIQPIIHQYKTKSFENKPIEDNCPIWVCWWQGIDSLHPLGRLCLKYLEKNKGNHEIILISEHNYQEYVSLDPIFLERLNKKEISFTHFTDVLRFALIKENGGIWLDSAILMLKPLVLNDCSFFSNKNLAKDNKYISNYRWTGGVLAGGKDSLLFNFIYDCYLIYWKKNSQVVSFMIMDYLIDIAYELFSEVRKQIDEVPIINPDFYALKSLFNSPYDSNIVEHIFVHNTLLSLNRRFSYQETDNNRKTTYYGYFKQRVES